MDDDFYQIETPIQGIRIIHRGLSIAVQRWPGGDPHEQVELMAMRDNFYRIILEHQFESMQ